MGKLLDQLLNFVFRKESAYLEAVSGVLLLALAVQASPYVYSSGVSTAMLASVGIAQIASLAMFSCQRCYATRTLTASAGAFVWVSIAAHQVDGMGPVTGATIASVAGALILAFTMFLASINILKSRNAD